MSNAALVQVGVIDPDGAAIPLWVDPNALSFTVDPVTVTLIRPFRELNQPGWPVPPGRTGAHAPAIGESAWPEGTSHTLFANVAAALVAAGAAIAADAWSKNTSPAFFAHVADRIAAGAGAAAQETPA